MCLGGVPAHSAARVRGRERGAAGGAHERGAIVREQIGGRGYVRGASAGQAQGQAGSAAGSHGWHCGGRRRPRSGVRAGAERGPGCCHGCWRALPPAAAAPAVRQPTAEARVVTAEAA
jgi:hypothetical protein